MKREFTFV